MEWEDLLAREREAAIIHTAALDAERKQPTVREAVDEFMCKIMSEKKSAPASLYRLNRFVAPLGGMKIRDVTRQDVIKALDAIAVGQREGRPAKQSCGEVWTLAKRVCRFAKSREWVNTSALLVKLFVSPSLLTRRSDTQPPPATLTSSPLRLPPNYGAALGVKKLLINVPVSKLQKAQFFRIHPSDDMTFAALLLEQKESRESYMVMPEVASQSASWSVPVQLYAAIDRQNNVFLIPVPLPGEDGTRNPWHESRARAVELAKPKWVRINANKFTGGYDVYEAPCNEIPRYDERSAIVLCQRLAGRTDAPRPACRRRRAEGRHA